LERRLAPSVSWTLLVALHIAELPEARHGQQDYYAATGSPPLQSAIRIPHSLIIPEEGAQLLNHLSDSTTAATFLSWHVPEARFIAE
jgi:hypothetical protein